MDTDRPSSMVPRVVMPIVVSKKKFIFLKFVYNNLPKVSGKNSFFLIIDRFHPLALLHLMLNKNMSPNAKDPYAMVTQPLP